MPSPLSDPLVVIPGSAFEREDGRFVWDVDGVGTVVFAETTARKPYVCSVLMIPREVGEPVLAPFAPTPTMNGVKLCPEGFDLLTISEGEVVLVVWPQNLGLTGDRRGFIRPDR